MYNFENQKLSCVKEDKILLLFVDINDFGHTKSETKKDIFFLFQRGVPPFFSTLTTGLYHAVMDQNIHTLFHLFPIN